MGCSIRTLLILFILSATTTVVYSGFLIIREYQKPLPHQIQKDNINISFPKNKIQNPDNGFMKISQSSGVTFILDETRNVSQKEIHCLAKNIYHEARGEGFVGMMGVAQITLNRADKQYRGKSNICSVVNDSNQFSWTGNKKKQNKLNQASWQQSIHIAQLVLLGIRIRELEDSIYFYSHKNKSPDWSKHLPVNKRIGNHIYLGSI